MPQHLRISHTILFLARLRLAVATSGHIQTLCVLVPSATDSPATGWYAI